MTSPLPHSPSDAVRVVVADDSQPFLKLVVFLVCQTPGLELVGAAGDGREAVRLAVEREADAVLLDVEMPFLDGFDAAGEIRRLRPHTTLVLHTADSVDDRRRRGDALDLGVFDKLDLTATLDKLADGARAAA